MAACILCGSESASVVFSYSSPDRYEKALGIQKEGYWRQWLRCTDCGLHRSEGSSSGRLEEIYPRLYREAGGLRQESPEEIFLRILQLPPTDSETFKRVEWLAQAILSLEAADLAAPPRSLLDAGGASGVFAHAMSERSWQASVIDPSSSAIFFGSTASGTQRGATRMNQRARDSASFPCSMS